MYEKTIPESQEKRLRRGKALTHVQKAVSIFSFIAAVAAVAALIGVVVLFFLLEFSSVGETLLFILMGSFFAGTLFLAVAAFLLMRAAERLEKRRDDFLERCDSEASFFVGEGTLATFAEEKLILHAEGKKDIAIPYGELRFLSVCTRRAAREKGFWSVVIEIPARYLLKDAKEAKKEPPALVQTDMKPRLLGVLSERGLPLLGELPPETPSADRKFKVEKKFYLPHAKKRRNALIALMAGVVLAVAGVPLSFWNVTVGIIAGMVGLLVFGKSLHSYFRARAMLGVYREGVFWQDTDRAENVFLKWEEIERLAAEEKDELPVLAVYCAYGAYRFPLPAGGWEYLTAAYPERCGIEAEDQPSAPKGGPNER